MSFGRRQKAMIPFVKTKAVQVSTFFEFISFHNLAMGACFTITKLDLLLNYWKDIHKI